MLGGVFCGKEEEVVWWVILGVFGFEVGGRVVGVV